MAQVEVSQLSLPPDYLLLRPLERQVAVAEAAGYKGMEAHLTNGLSTFQLLSGRVSKAAANFVGGIHQSARSERWSDQKYWPRSLFGLAFLVLMRHYRDSLPDLKRMAVSVGKPDMPAVLYPSVDRYELRVTAGLTRLFQPKIEVAEMFGISGVEGWLSLLGNEPRWAGLCYDTQHSSLIIPMDKIPQIRERVGRVHVSVGRSDLEKKDRQISASPLLTGKKDQVLYPMLMTLLGRKKGQVPLVVESGRMSLIPINHWVGRHAQMTGTLRRWTQGD